MAVEAAFGVAIPDREVERIRTPRELVAYVSGRLPLSDAAAPVCLSRRAFHRARRACASRFGHRRGALGPGTPLRDILPGKGTRAHWRALQGDVDVAEWPLFADRIGTLGQLARTVAAQNAAALRRPDEPWSTAEVERIVVALIEMELGVDMDRHTLDSRFVADMGVG